MIAPLQPTNVPTDTELMLRVSRGNAQAFVQLYEKHYRPTLRVVSYLMGNHSHSEDLAQLVFVKIYEARKRYVPSAKFSTWLYSIVQNVVLNAKRNLSRQQQLLSRLQDTHRDVAHGHEPSHTHDPLTIALRSEVRQHVTDLIGQLSRNQQRAVQLVHLQGRSYREAAAELNVSLPAIKLLLYRARTNLRNMAQLKLDDYALDESDEDAGPWLTPYLAD